MTTSNRGCSNPSRPIEAALLSLVLFPANDELQNAAMNRSHSAVVLDRLRGVTRFNVKNNYLFLSFSICCLTGPGLQRSSIDRFDYNQGKSTSLHNRAIVREALISGAL